MAEYRLVQQGLVLLGASLIDAGFLWRSNARLLSTITDQVSHCTLPVLCHLTLCVCVLPQLPATAVDPGPGSVELRALMRGSRCPVRFLRVLRQGGVAISDGRLHYVSP